MITGIQITSSKLQMVRSTESGLVVAISAIVITDLALNSTVIIGVFPTESTVDEYGTLWEPLTHPRGWFQCTQVNCERFAVHLLEKFAWSRGRVCVSKDFLDPAPEFEPMS